MEKKAVMLGGGVESTGCASGAGLVFNNLLEREQEIRSTELINRRKLLTNLSEFYLNHRALKKFETMNNQVLRDKSSDFRFIHNLIKDLGIADMAISGLGLSKKNVNRVCVILGSLLHSKRFCAMNLESNTTDYFKLTLALYVGLKGIGDRLTQDNVGTEAYNRFVFVSSEIGIRIYSMYTDNRQDM